MIQYDHQWSFRYPQLWRPLFLSLLGNLPCRQIPPNRPKERLQRRSIWIVLLNFLSLLMIDVPPVTMKWPWSHDNQRMRAINERGRKFINGLKGFSRKAYLCPANIWNIGYGATTGSGQRRTCWSLYGSLKNYPGFLICWRFPVPEEGKSGLISVPRECFQLSIAQLQNTHWQPSFYTFNQVD